MKIAHISDLHWLDLSGVKFTDFFNKRWTGGFNLLAGRAKTHLHEVVIAALDAIRAQNCDHLVVTGDLTNLAFPSEFSAVKSLLDSYFPAEKRLIVPGNHDFYTRESGKAHRFEKMIYSDVRADIVPDSGNVWPFAQINENVALIGLCSAQPRPWFVAAGRLGMTQLNDLDKLLSNPRVASCCKILALHHHLYQVVTAPGEMFRHLDDRQAFLELCHKHHVDLIVHGHNHDFTQYRSQETVISEAGSCSVAHAERDNRRGKFNIYNIEGNKLSTIETYHYDEASKSFKLWKTTPLKDIPDAPPLR